MNKKMVIVSFFLLPLFTHAYSSPGRPTGFVNDYAEVLSAEQKTNLETKLNNFEKSSTNEISVVTIKSLDGDTVENYAEKLFQERGIGKKDKDNGALLLVAVDDHKMRIEVGYGLEGDLTDILSSRIIRETLTPAFQQDDFYGGIDKAVDQMMVITGGTVPVELQQDNVSPKINSDIIWFFLFGILWLSSVLARSKSWWGGGVVGGVIAIIVGFIFSFLFAGLIAFIVLVPVGLLLDFLVSRAYSKSKNSGTRPPWWIGGGGFGGGSSGGGFGGFSGGSSGGGGSSGSW